MACPPWRGRPGGPDYLLLERACLERACGRRWRKSIPPSAVARLVTAEPEVKTEGLWWTSLRMKLRPDMQEGEIDTTEARQPTGCRGTQPALPMRTRSGSGRCRCRMEGARAPGYLHETCRACPARLMRGRRGRRRGTTKRARRNAAFRMGRLAGRLLSCLRSRHDKRGALERVQPPLSLSIRVARAIPYASSVTAPLARLMALESGEGALALLATVARMMSRRRWRTGC
jgi:hypothetical protein